MDSCAGRSNLGIVNFRITIHRSPITDHKCIFELRITADFCVVTDKDHLGMYGTSGNLIALRGVWSVLFTDHSKEPSSPRYSIRIPRLLS